MNVLVTGVAGFLGSHVADDLICNGHNVIGIDNLTGGNMINVHKDIKFYNGDICDQRILEKIFYENNVNAVIHLAAYAAEGLSHFIKKYNYNNNLIGSINLITLSIKKNVDVFVFISSIAVYGNTPCPLYENSIPYPVDPYGIAKYAFELELICSNKIFGLPYVIFRPHNVYGPRQNIMDPYRNVIGIFMNQIINNNPITILGDGNQSRAFSYIKDVAPVIAKSIDEKKCWNQIFNIGADKPYSILELIEKMNFLFHNKINISFHEERNEVKHVFADHSKAKYFFGNFENTPLKNGLELTKEWVLNYKNHFKTILPGIEINNNIPEYWKTIR